MLVICVGCGWEWVVDPYIEIPTERESGEHFAVRIKLSKEMLDTEAPIRVPVCGRCAPADYTAAVLRKDDETVLRPPGGLWRPN